MKRTVRWATILPFLSRMINIARDCFVSSSSEPGETPPSRDSEALRIAANLCGIKLKTFIRGDCSVQLELKSGLISGLWSFAHTSVTIVDTLSS